MSAIGQGSRTARNNLHSCRWEERTLWPHGLQNTRDCLPSAALLHTRPSSANNRRQPVGFLWRKGLVRGWGVILIFIFYFHFSIQIPLKMKKQTNNGSLLFFLQFFFKGLCRETFHHLFFLQENPYSPRMLTLEPFWKWIQIHLDTKIWSLFSRNYLHFSNYSRFCFTYFILVLFSLI